MNVHEIVERRDADVLLVRQISRVDELLAGLHVHALFRAAFAHSECFSFFFDST